MPAPITSASSSRHLAQGIVLVVLVGTLLIGWYENREISPVTIPLEDLPRRIGAWETVWEETTLPKGEAYKFLRRVYENNEGQRIHVRVHATYTRLGGLRDWSLASMADGWSVEEASIWDIKNDAVGFTGEASIQRLAKGAHRRAALNWYTSARLQAPTLQLAAFKAWPDWLLTGRKPWANMYLLADTGPEWGAESATKELAQQLAPEVRDLMSQL